MRVTPKKGFLLHLVSLAAVVVIGPLLLSCAALLPADVATSEIERARQALAPFKRQLMGALMGALGEGSANAIRVCRDEAPRIAESLSVDGVEMGRTSHRLRNPDNAPAEWVEPLLAASVENPDLDGPRAVGLDEGRFGYVEPIRAAQLCMSCHGSSVEPGLLEEIRAAYPQDEATGFGVGDLRGLFWVTMPLDDDPE